MEDKSVVDSSIDANVVDYPLTAPKDDIPGTQGAKRLNTYTAEYTIATNSRLIRDTANSIKADTSSLVSDLAAVKSSTANIRSDLVTVKDNTDEVEGKLTSLNTTATTISSDLATVKANTDDLETQFTSALSKLDNIVSLLQQILDKE